MASVFVVGGNYFTGGAEMARRVGQLAAALTGGELVDVPLAEEDLARNPPHPAFARAVLAPALAPAPEDVLVVNPSFSTLHCAARFPGRKIMFVQSFSIPKFVDAPFDLHISNSKATQRWLRNTWGIRSQVIEPFVSVPPPEAQTPAPAADLLVYLKADEHGESRLWEGFYEAELRKRGLSYSVLAGNELPQEEFFAVLRRHRGALFLQLSEGYGHFLVETAILGVIPFGFDGNGGRDFARRLPRRTLHPWPQHHAVLRSLDAFRAAPATFQISQKTREKLRAHYSRERFDRQWLRALRRVLR